MRNKALIYVIFLVLLAWLQMEHQQNVAASIPENDVIPEEAIRLRILAHDDSPKEQLLKREVRDAVNQEVRTLVTELKEKKEARETIDDHLTVLEDIVQSVLDRYDSDHNFSIALKAQVEFPTRIYGPLVYPAGTYEALVISIGEGEGANWWCVLFPPLCFIPADEEQDTEKEVDNTNNVVDNSSVEEENVDKSTSSVDGKRQYSFFIVEKWKKWFGKS